MKNGDDNETGGDLEDHDLLDEEELIEGSGSDQGDTSLDLGGGNSSSSIMNPAGGGSGGHVDSGDNGDHVEKGDTSASANEDDCVMDDTELEAIKARVREMEEEAEKLKQLQSEVDRQMNIGSPPSGSTSMSVEEKMEVDMRSVYVGNVDYGATAEELEQHFHGCGSINRVTILCNKFDGHPKGFAYIEFTDKESVNTAQALDESLFRGRQIKVMLKRTNRPGLSRTERPPRGGRGASAGFPRGRGRGFSAYRGHPRFPRRGGYRGRGMYYSPY